jgi:glutathione synthase/RimK-type ligase-like ATP-grasp enzyme
MAVEPGGRVRRTVTTAERTLDLEAVRVVYHRRPSPPSPSERVRDPFMRAYVETEAKHVLEDLWSSLSCAFVPAPADAMRRADRKLVQLQAASALCLEVPASLITNDPSALLEFHAANEGGLVSKLPGPGLYRQREHRAVRFTESVGRGELANVAAVAYAPVTFQARIDKAVEIRATVVGDRVLAAEIDSQGNRRTSGDWRRYDMAHTAHRAHELPADLAARLVTLAQRFGLRYAAIDLILTPDGRYVFLELNPNGQYLWIEELTGLPITEAICELLLAQERDDGQE